MFRFQISVMRNIWLPGEFFKDKVAIVKQEMSD